MSLTDPGAKMSKSDPDPESAISLRDDPEAVRRKIRHAKTDPGREIVPSPDKPGITNLLTLMAAVTGEEIPSLVARYAGVGYSRFKADLAEAVVSFLTPIQSRHRALMNDPGELDRILRQGAEKARERSLPMLRRVHEALGFIPA